MLKFMYFLLIVSILTYPEVNFIKSSDFSFNKKFLNDRNVVNKSEELLAENSNKKSKESKLTKDDNKPKLNKDTIFPPKIQVKPNEIFAKITEGKFLTREVKVLNRGGKVLSIRNVTSSCRCGSAKILNGSVEPLGIGILQLNVNRDAITEENNIVDFIVESNAENSTYSIRFVIDTVGFDSLRILRYKRND